jgi:alkanesulfonate monooxygenase SsuD/methylene tetrahydromethanopterin reductase-like flavin-dependent oxidoreductase (luciferase family)
LSPAGISPRSRCSARLCWSTTIATNARPSGGSEKGQHFAAKYCDMVYVVFGSHNFDDCKAKVDAYRNLARKEYAREIQVWSYAYVVQGDTEKEAQDYFDYYVHQKGEGCGDQSDRHHDRQR